MKEALVPVGRRADLEKVRDEFATWLTIEPRTRRKVGLPTTIAEFAELKQVSERTCRRWKNDDPEFGLLVEQRAADRVGFADGGAVSGGLLRARPSTSSKRRSSAPLPALPTDVEVRQAAVEAGLEDPDELDYVSIKQAIVEGATAGDSQTLAAYMKWWGHEYAEREREARESDFAELDDEALAFETLDLIGRDTVEAWLAGTS